MTKIISQKRGSKSGTAKLSKNDRFVIIMAGGRGERFWPVSREKTPKQLLTLLDRKSFLQQTVHRVLPLVPLKNIFIITNAVQAPAVRKQLPRLPKGNVIAEPCGRDTCAAVALGAALVGAQSSSGVMAVLPADHVIKDEKTFQKVLGDSFETAFRDPVMVTIGMKPTEPNTGYGYIRVGARFDSTAGGTKPLKTDFFKARKFVEKPNLTTAQSYLKSGDYRWNAGMFIWSFPTVIQGLKDHQPDLAKACQRWLKASVSKRLTSVLARDYPKLKKVSVDYALMEKARNVVVADGKFTWDDLGSWTALARHLKLDADGNCAPPHFIHVDATRNIIFDARTKNRTPIAVVGMKDAILVQTDDALLLADQSQAGKIKELVSKLAKSAKYKKLV